jgi:hypothetical protein
LNKKKKLISINDILINSKFVSLQTLINTWLRVEEIFPALTYIYIYLF